jgi:hypothetical protein
MLELLIVELFVHQSALSWENSCTIFMAGGARKFGSCRFLINCGSTVALLLKTE